MTPAPVLQQAYSEHRAQMLAALIRVLGDFELAEDALQDACALALRKWHDIVPDDPVAWLLATARNSAIDRVAAGSGQPGEAPRACQTARHGDHDDGYRRGQPAQHG